MASARQTHACTLLRMTAFVIALSVAPALLWATPSGTVVINGGASTTASTTVTLTLSASDSSGSVTKMRFSNDGMTYSAQEPYATTKTWILSGGDGTKTVYAQFRGASGIWSAAATDTILLDTASPTLSGIAALDVLASSATINWSTNESATSQVEYGTATSYGQSSPFDSTLAITHKVFLSGLSAGMFYHYRVWSKDATGNTATSADQTFTTAATSIPSNAFLGEYWNLPSTSDMSPLFPVSPPTLTRTDPIIDFSWGSSAPAAGINVDDFAVRWQGVWTFATAGTYEFSATVDDGIRLYLDGTLLINQWKDQAATTYTAQAAMTAGTHTIKVEFYENGGAAAAQVSWKLIPAGDTTAPTGSVTMNGGASATSTTAVTLALSATDNSGSVSQMQFSNDGATYSTAEAYATTKAWTLSSGDGTKTVYAKFKDAAGNWSAAATDTIGLDTTPPALLSISATNITATGATITWITNEPATSQVDYGPTTAYGQTTPLDSTLVTNHSVPLSGLTAGMLYHYRVRSGDALGITATSVDATFTTVAAGDTTPPTGAVLINGAAAATNNTVVTLTLSATDNAGAVAQMQLSNDGATYSSPETYATTKSWTLSSGDGTKTVYVKFKDAAGNWSTPATDTITLDTAPPQLSITSPTDGAVLVAP